MVSLFIGFLVERVVACQSPKSDFGWHRFRFSPCWMRVEKSQAILALLDSSSSSRSSSSSSGGGGGGGGGGGSSSSSSSSSNSSSSSSTSSCKNKCHYGNLDKRQGLNRNLMRNSERNEIGKVKYCKQKKKWKNDLVFVLPQGPESSEGSSISSSDEPDGTPSTMTVDSSSKSSDLRSSPLTRFFLSW